MAPSALFIMNETSVARDSCKDQAFSWNARVANEVCNLKPLSRVGHNWSGTTNFSKCVENGAGQRFYIIDDDEIPVQKLPHRQIRYGSLLILNQRAFTKRFGRGFLIAH